MDNLVTLSWLAYFGCSLVFLYASWRLFYFFPLFARLVILFSQSAILFVPTRLDATAQAPAFIVLILDIIQQQLGKPLIGSLEVAEILGFNELVIKYLPLIISLAVAWPLAYLFAFIIKKLAKSRKAKAEKKEKAKQKAQQEKQLLAETSVEPSLDKQLSASEFADAEDKQFNSTENLEVTSTSDNENVAANKIQQLEETKLATVQTSPAADKLANQLADKAVTNPSRINKAASPTTAKAAAINRSPSQVANSVTNKLQPRVAASTAQATSRLPSNSSVTTNKSSYINKPTISPTTTRSLTIKES